MAQSKGRSLAGPKVGEWSFLVGVLLAIVLGLFPQPGWQSTVTLVLVVLGIIVALVNVTSKETSTFLVAAIALLVAASAGGAGGFGSLPVVGAYLINIFDNLVVFVAPAAVIVGLKAIYALAKD
ncbi:MAG: hypothetical protein HYT70_04625 [Candidatus Aenigmarchaeota archaeon]|nr:hypothetical protein [Candidatus Aenigmarchaeota archaeon]